MAISQGETHHTWFEPSVLPCVEGGWKGLALAYLLFPIGEMHTGIKMEGDSRRAGTDVYHE